MKRKIVLVGFLVVLLSVFTCIWLGALHVGAIDAEQISILSKILLKCKVLMMN